MKTTICAAAVVAAFACVTQTPARAACIAINTAAQLQAISNHLDRDYCLGKDIDLGMIANFTPIATEPDMFTGTFDGGGHVIRNLKTNHNDVNQVGLFGLVKDATIKNLTLENVQVINRKNATTVGALAGTAQGTTHISNVQISSGAIAYNAINGIAGGLVGYVTESGLVELSSSAVDVGAKDGSFAGGLIGIIDTNSTLRTSYATGQAFCAGANCTGGGLAGGAAGAGVSVTRSFATGTVVCSDFCGGLVGDANGAFSFLYASGTVLGDSGATTGGLFGRLTNPVATTVTQSFAVGLLGGGASTFGGLVADTSGSPTVTKSYWDKITSGGVTTSAAGTGRNTTQLQLALPAGFAAAQWGVTRNYSYPYLKTAAIKFNPQVATRITGNLIFSFLPISELDKANYTGTTNNADEASLANCYTMIARAIGNTLDVGQLQGVKIDRYFWNDTTRKTFWRGPVTTDATLGALKPIPAAARLNATVIAEMKKNNIVLLRGKYTIGARKVESWMLGTLFSTNANGAPDAVFANDPATGQQVQIDPATKKVVSPANFRLRNFTVDGYQPVTIVINR
jgi:hypothetical protein